MVLPVISPWSATAATVFSGAVVDRAGGDELDDVPGVVVLGVLDTGGRPQWSLFVCALWLPGLPAGSGERLLERLVGQPGVGEGGLEDRRVGGDPADVPGADQVLQVARVQSLTDRSSSHRDTPCAVKSASRSVIGVRHVGSPSVTGLKWKSVAGAVVHPGRSPNPWHELVSLLPIARPDRRCRRSRIPTVSRVWVPESRHRRSGPRWPANTRPRSTRPRRLFLAGGLSSSVVLGVTDGGVGSRSHRRPLPAHPR